MKKTLKLKPVVRTTLETITMILGIMTVSITDFSISALPIILLMIATIIFNVEILEKF